MAEGAGKTKFIVLIHVEVLQAEIKCKTVLFLIRMFRRCGLISICTLYDSYLSTWSEYMLHTVINPLMPRVPYIGGRQTVQTQIRCHKMWHLIWVCTVCIYGNWLFLLHEKGQNNPLGIMPAGLLLLTQFRHV